MSTLDYFRMHYRILRIDRRAPVVAFFIAMRRALEPVPF